MKPEAGAMRLMSAVRSTAKMHEFRVAAEDFIDIPRDPRILFAQAIGILGDASAAIAENFIEPEEADGRPETWNADDGSVSEMLRFSATFFDAYLDAQLDEEITTEFSLLCAASYYLSDSVGSAMVVASRSEPPGLELGHGLACIAYRILRNSFAELEGEFPHADFAEHLFAALRAHFDISGDAGVVRHLCKELRTEVYENGSARELLYADLVTALCARKLHNSARNLIPPSSGLPAEVWQEALLRPNFPIELWPAQQRVCDAGLLRGRSAVIQMPTSAGKTRATEMIIRAHFLARRSTLAVIVAPFRSLCHDIRSDLAKAFAEDDVLLDEVSDSYLFDVEIEDVLAQNSVLIVTPEKMLYMLRRAPELAERIGLAIYDEGHQFEGMSRGPTYELLLSSLRMTLSPEAQVVLISAVIGNAPQIAEWLIRDASAVVHGRGLLPTARNIAFASWKRERGQLRYVSPADPDESEFYVPRIIDTLPLAKLSKRERVRVFPERDRPLENSESAEIGLYLGLHLVPNGSVALFCGQRSAVTKMCKRAAEIFERNVPLAAPLASSSAQEIRRLTHLISVQLGADCAAAKAAALGVLGHHSNTPHGVRLSIEHAMKEGKARLVACTSTLAQGVNFPIRYLIVTGTQQGTEKIKVRDFHNLMGRAGRAGMYTEGNVIFSAPDIYDQRRTDRNKWNAAKELLDPANSEPTTSSILQIFDSYRQFAPTLNLNLRPTWLDLAFAGNERLEAIVTSALRQFPNLKVAEFRKFVAERAKAVQSIAAYLAAYVDFDSDLSEDRVTELAENTLAFHLADAETREKLLEVFRSTARAIENNSDADFRAIIRRSPLPPADILELKNWIGEKIEQLREDSQEGDLADTLIEKLLTYVRANSLKRVSDQALIVPALKAWISGATFAEIRAPMTAVDARVSGDKVTVEHIVALCESGFGYELAMVVASAADLLEPLDDDLCYEAATLQRQIKCGLSDAAALAFYEAGFSDRIVAQAMGEAFDEVTDRSSVRRVCRRRREDVAAILSDFPSYFEAVAAELRS
ncbi:MAG: DEAD/DEAH box helicase [Mesorhizobium sp.]|nr:MAG: DEAD/DEAH box helicase [Mesorhizobium sp.]